MLGECLRTRCREGDEEMKDQFIEIGKYDDIWLTLPNGEKCILRVNSYGGLDIVSHIGPVVSFQSGAVNVVSLSFPKFSNGICTRCREECSSCKVKCTTQA